MHSNDLQGQALGPYTLVALIGEGGFSTVWRASGHPDHPEVAIRVMTPHKLTSEWIERFNREVETLSSLAHPHILPMLDFGIRDDIPYLVMPLLNDSLESLSRRGASLSAISHILTHIASALDYAHSREVIHRALKPGNILIDDRGVPFLADFRLVEILRNDPFDKGAESENIVVGAMPYLSPEDLHGKGKTPASDQYTLALTMYETVTGQLPPETFQPLQQAFKERYKLPQPLHLSRSDVPPALDAVINRALAWEPAERYPTITAFAEDFERAIRTS